MHLLTRSSYAKFTDDKGHSYYKMTYNESAKTHHGIDNRENDQEQRMHANLENPSICPVFSLDFYLSKLNKWCDSLFQPPLQFPKENVRYAAQPVVKNKLAGMMGRISSDANLSKRYTNHCIRATVATGLKRKGLYLLSIMSVTGHRNVKSLDSYIQAPDDSERRKISATLQNLAPIPVQSTSTSSTSQTLTSVGTSSSWNYSSSQSTTSTMNVSRNPLADHNVLQNATISGGQFTFHIVNKQ